ncbi:hypothetical protein CSIM01_06723 [Colletotrichum simmondsii]|uniref:Succinate dehydrogenase assembly factor 4, mitochondrial n=1 Tax=Colletotrichum simmondsii TaxID=703756 RepID=A0A135RVW6_9PEZI|nr:hypothetical protein CSIM01_06723 [Colletotrichum simmondsii]
MSRLLRLRPLLNLSKPSTLIPSRLSSTSAFSRGPAPPRLPADQQAEFERLQRQASVSSAFQHLVEEQSEPPADASSTSADSSPSSVAAEATTIATASEPATTATPTIAATDEDTMHPNYVRGAPAEFEGDVNPRTGEVGGPKREPLRWGSGGDWSYNGRVTDF